jgi:predicted negative regulator of RcsB-dependent stress response
MAYDLQEQEQLAELKAWWASYGTLLLGALLVAALGFAGWRGYEAWRGKQAITASTLFDAAQSALEAKDEAKLKTAVSTLTDQYPRTLYASMAALDAAKHYAEAGDLKSAEAQLQWVVDRSPSDESRALARLRLAGLMLDQQRYDDGLKVLDKAGAPAAFEPLFADRRGDLYVAMKKPDEARKAYQVALEKLSPQSSALRNVVQLKLDALGEG